MKSALEKVFSFPNPVNEVAARLVAGMVVVLIAAIVGLNRPELLVVLAYGFVARVLTGPTLSPMGLLATRVLVPGLGLPVRHTPGPPKRFAQGIGAVFSVTAAVLWLGLGLAVPARIVLGALAAFASVETLTGFCAGCFVFGYLMKWGVVPAPVCEACRNIRVRT